MRAIAILVGLVACGAPDATRSAIGNTPAAVPTTTVGEMLTLEVGKTRSVAILAGPEGLRAISSDGARVFRLSMTPTWFALIDARANVIWYGAEKQICMIDLDAHALAETIIVDNVPVGWGMVGPQNVTIAYIGDADPEAFGMPSTEYALNGSVVMRTLGLYLSQRDGLTFGGESGYEVNDEYNEAVKQAKLVASPDLGRKLAARKSREPAVVAPIEVRAPGVDPSRCLEPKECGTGNMIPGTHFAKILVEHVSGDVGHFAWKLWDAEAKRFIPGDWFAGLEHTSVAPDRSAFVARGALIRFDGGPLPSTPIDGGQGGGFLGGQTF